MLLHINSHRCVKVYDYNKTKSLTKLLNLTIKLANERLLNYEKNPYVRYFKSESYMRKVITTFDNNDTWESLEAEKTVINKNKETLPSKSWPVSIKIYLYCKGYLIILWKERETTSSEKKKPFIYYSFLY